MEAPTRPTLVRHLIIALTTLAAILLYLDRYCISFAERYIKEDLGLSNEQVSWVLSAFFWTYALGQVPSGFLTDRFGARITLTLYIVLWSLFTGLTGLATGFVMLLLLRFGFGLAQAGAYPASANLISKWATFQARGLASGIVSFGGRVGGFMAPIAMAMLIVFYVSTGVSSLIMDEDILDYPQVCHQIAKLDARTSKALLASLYPAEYENLLQQGRGYEQQIHNYFRQDVDRLTNALNAALDNRYLFDAVSLKGRELPNEAKALLDRPLGELSKDEVQRLNRLIVEALISEGLRRLYGLGWRPAMMMFGLVGLLVAGVFWFWFRERPDVHPFCNRAEVDLIEGSRPADAPSPHGKATRVPLGQLMSSVGMWLMCIAQFGTNIGWLFLPIYLPRYLDEVHQVPIETRSLLASLPLLAGWAGLLGGGWFTDWIAKRVSPRWSRGLPIALTRFASMAAYVACLVYGDLWFVMVAFCLVAFFCDFGIPSMWAFNLDIGGRYVASVLGWGNMWGNLGAAVSPPLLNKVVGEGQWDRAFIVCAAAFLVSGLCALGIDASKPIKTAEEPGAPP